MTKLNWNPATAAVIAEAVEWAAARANEDAAFAEERLRLARKAVRVLYCTALWTTLFLLLYTVLILFVRRRKLKRK